MTVVINGTTGITDDGGYTGDGVVFADTTPANTLVTTTGGNVGIGTNAPTAKLDLRGSGTSTSFRGNINAIIGSNGAGYDSTLRFTDSVANSADISMKGGVLATSVNGVFATYIDSSGNLLVGTTTAFGTSGLTFSPPDVSGCWSACTSASGVIHWRFYNPNGVVGAITTNGSSTTYSTSSDYRLKHDIQPMTGALARVAALKPCTYKWKVDGSDGEGFIAHELAEVVPQCVTGNKDAVDADGNPVYQGIDTSFLVATLTAALQEQQAIIQQLQADVAALKGA